MISEKFPDHSLVKRILVALVCAPVIVWIFLSRGGTPLYIFLAGLTALGQWELYRMFSEKLHRPHRIIGYIAGLAILTDAFIARSACFSCILVTALILSFGIEIVSGKNHRLWNVMFSLFTVVYPASFVSFFIKINQLPLTFLDRYKHVVLVFILLVIWTFDTVSYFAGRIFGTRRFFPHISPKKTLEGFLGGIFSIMVLGLAVGFLIDHSLRIHAFCFSLLIGVTGQLGDLSESLIKREMHTKDSSGIIPGHGGILDRFDSLIFAGPAAYVYLFMLCLQSGVKF